jgi:hypothetical protein
MERPFCRLTFLWMRSFMHFPKSNLKHVCCPSDILKTKPDEHCQEFFDFTFIPNIFCHFPVLFLQLCLYSLTSRVLIPKFVQTDFETAFGTSVLQPGETLCLKIPSIFLPYYRQLSGSESKRESFKISFMKDFPILTEYTGFSTIAYALSGFASIPD